MKQFDRVKTLQNLGIIALTVISLYYLNLLFNRQISILFTAINSILLPFGIALFISYLVAPLMKLLETKAKIKHRWVAIVLVFLVLISFISLLFFMIGDIVITQANLFIQSDWEQILVSIEDFVSQNEFLKGPYESLMTSLNTAPQPADFLSVVNVFRGIISVIIVIVLVPVFLVFILHDREKIFIGILNVVPKKKRVHIEELGKRAHHIIEKYFNGRFLSMMILGILFTITLLIFGFSIDKAIFFGFTLGFLDIIPYVGGFIGISLPVLYSFTITDTVLFGQYAFTGIILVNFVLQFLQGNVIQPYIMGKEVNMHPLLVLCSFLFFGALFGVTGIILAIPLTGTIITTVDYYNEVKTKEEVQNGKRNGENI